MRPFLLPALLLAVSGAATAQQPAPGAIASRAALTDADRERFLLEGEIERRRSAPGGITGSQRVTLSLDGLQHDAHVQDIDQQHPQASLSGGLEVDFRDSWRGNVAAYRLDRLLGLGMVPVTVVRRDGTRTAAFTWWVDDFLMDERTRLKKKARAPDLAAWNRQVYAVRMFDQLIYNFDRNLGNLIIDEGWRIWMIDHSRSFKTFKELKSPKNLGQRCPRTLLAGLRRLDEATLEKTMSDVIDRYQIAGLLARRDAIVAHFDARIAREGEAAVLYDLPARGATAGPR